jgi:hypothetical protein
VCVGAKWHFDRTGVQAGVQPGEASPGDTVESVVEKSRPQLHECWDRAFLKRARDAPSEARIDATIVVSSSGTIERVTTTGDPVGYPNLAVCVESKIRRWQFPKRPESTTVDVPFMFGGP